MKKINVARYEAALVFKNGGYRRLLLEGNYWLWGGETAEIYRMTEQFQPAMSLDLLLKNAELAAALDVVEVKEQEIALKYQHGLLVRVLTAGRYAYWKDVIDYEIVKVNIGQPEIGPEVNVAMLQHSLLAAYVRSSNVESYEKALLFVNGRYERMLQPGVYYWWKNAVPIQVGKVDTRKQQLEINGQEILTKDKAALRINAWAQYTVKDIEQALLKSKEYDKQLYVSLQLALREYVSGLSFDELLDRKETIGAAIQQKIGPVLALLGVELGDLGIRDIILPGDMKEIMNQVLVAEKKAQSNIIMRREETASTRSLLNTAKLMEDNSMLWKLKEMEYIEKIADRISNISVSGNGVLIEQLKEIFLPKK